MNIMVYLRRPSFRVWKLEPFNTVNATPPVKKKKTDEDKVDISRLSELSLIVDTGGSFRGGETPSLLEPDDELDLK